MIPGSDFIFKCPQCGELLSRGSNASSNTFHAEHYSDGKIIAPNMPDYPSISKCKKCSHIFWLDESALIGQHDCQDDTDSEWLNAETAEFLDINDYFEAIDKGLATDTGTEIYLRQRILWLYNDRIRDNDEISKNDMFTDENDEKKWLANAEKLLAILDKSNPSSIFLSAEINRYLGDFYECIELSESVVDDKFDWLKIVFLRKCHIENTFVFKF